MEVSTRRQETSVTITITCNKLKTWAILAYVAVDSNYTGRVPAVGVYICGYWTLNRFTFISSAIHILYHYPARVAVALVHSN